MTTDHYRNYARNERPSTDGNDSYADQNTNTAVNVVYLSVHEQLLNWGEEPKYLFDEFSNALENDDQDDLEQNYNQEDLNEEDPDPYEDFEQGDSERESEN
jgi:hypothetical protein